VSPRPGVETPDDPPRVHICVEESCAEATLSAGEHLVRLTPESGRAWDDRVYYKLRAAGLPASDGFGARLRVVEFKVMPQ